jgi:hypothetical protein
MKEHVNDDLDHATNGGHKTITVQAGTAAAGTAPIKLTSGALLTTPEAGAIEFLSDNLYFTQSTSTTRKKVALYDDSSGATGDIYYRDSSGYFKRLGVGSSGDLLTVSSGLPVWSSTLTGKTLDNTSTVTLKDTNFTLQDNADTTKQLQFDLTAISTGTPRTLSVPDASTTLVGTDAVQILTNKTLTSPKLNRINDTNGNLILNFSVITSAVNSIEIANAATGGAPYIFANGSDTNINLNLYSKGTGTVNLRSSPNGLILSGSAPASAVNYFSMTSSATGSSPAFSSTGSDTNIDLLLVAKGTGVVKADGVEVATISGTQTLTSKTLTTPKIDTIYDTGGAPVAQVGGTASAVNYVWLRNGIATNSVQVRASGSDTNIDLNLNSQGTGAVVMMDSLSNNIARFVPVTSPVNWWSISNSSTGNAVVASATGSDTNVSMNLTTKGTGTVQANGKPIITSVTGIPAVTGTPSSSNYLRGDGTWAAINTGDASTNTATSVDSEVALFSGTGGKTLKRATGSGIAKLTAGVLSTVTAPSGTIVGDTDTQILTNKTLSGANNTLSNIGPGSLTTGVSRRVATTQFGTGSDANYWAKLATFQASNDYPVATLILGITSISIPGTAIVTVTVRQTTSPTPPDVTVDVMGAAPSSIIGTDSFKVITGAYGAAVELWMQKKSTWGQFDVYELTRSTDFTTLTYNDGAAWQSSAPVGSGNNVVSNGVTAFGVPVVTTTGTQILTNKTLTTPKIAQINDTNGAAMLTFSTSASAVANVQIWNSASAPTIGAVGTSSNISMYLQPKGTGSVLVYAPTGVQPTIGADGADVNHDLKLLAKGSGRVDVSGAGLKAGTIYDTSGLPTLNFSPTASAVNYLRLSNAATGSAPSFQVMGTDTNVNFAIGTLGTGGIYVYSPSATAIPLQADGGGTNIGWNLTTKGTGKVQANGVEVATISGAQILTNKTISGSSGNVFSNIPESAITNLSTNYSRLVCTTGFGGTGTEDGANTWVKVATFSSGTTQFAECQLILSVTVSSSASPDGAIAWVYFRSNSTSSSPTVDVRILSKGGIGAMVLNDSFKVISDGWSSDMQLWFKKGNNYGQIGFYETSKMLNGGTLTYTSSPAWQSAVPTGAVNNVSSDGVFSGLKFASLSTVSGTQLISTVATGTAPITVASTTKVANLNADLLDDMTSTSAATGTTIMARDSNGDTTVRYLNSSYVNMSHAAGTNTTDTVFYSSTDNYIRKNTATGFKTSLALQNVDNTSDATKNVLSATKLTTARTIGGVSFDGTANISLPGVNTTGTQNTSGNAATATTATYVTNGNPDNGNNYMNFRVIQNSNSSVSNDGLYIGYGNSNSGDTRLFGGGNTATPVTIGNGGTVTASSTVSGTRLISTVATGTAPLTVSSTTAVTNLNADMVDGFHASSFEAVANKNAANGYIGADSSGKVALSRINATGTPSSSTWLRGDGTWSASPTNASFTATIGNGSSTSIAVTHNLNTRNVVVSVKDATTYTEVMPDIAATSVNVVTLTFATAPTTNQYIVTIISDSATTISATTNFADNAFTLQDEGDTSKQLQFQLSGISAGATRTLIAPNANTTIAGTDAVQTLTNKRITARIGTITSSATPTIDITLYDQYNITLLATNITSLSTSGAATDGQKLMVRIKSDSSVRTIAWNTTNFQSSGAGILPTATVAGKTHHIGFIYDAVLGKWVCLAADSTGY